MPSFQKRTVYFNPYDFKNLNRVFPGDPNGTLSQRMAYVLTQEVIGKCDALIDMHCGDANEALIPYSYWMISETKAMDDRTEGAWPWPSAFGISSSTRRGPRTPRIPNISGTRRSSAASRPSRRKPGFSAGRTKKTIVRNINGAMSVMRLLKMIEGRPETVADPVWIDKYEVVNSNTDGLFFPRIAMGGTVTEGQTVGIVQDYMGDVKEEVKAPFGGIILYIIGTPPANKGEPLFEVGRIKK